MIAEREHYADFVAEDFDSYATRKAQNGVHGNNVELQVRGVGGAVTRSSDVGVPRRRQAIGELYNRPIEVYRDDATTPANLFHAEYATSSAPLRLSCVASRFVGRFWFHI